ncbi:MAG: hypothetical protein Q9167_007522, partial [Letrouitia subvulpina]
MDEDNPLWGPGPTNQPAPASFLNLSKESRIAVDAIIPNSVIQIRIPATSSFGRASTSQSRILQTVPSYKDERELVNSYLARESSIYFGSLSTHPRNFLWRLLENRRVLEVRAVDLSKKDREKRDADFTLQLQLPSAIRHSGVAFADDGRDNLSAFLLTKGNELYTITLKASFFCLATILEGDPTHWCKVYKPATFSISTPHRLIAGSPTQLVVSLSDGRLLQLTRSTSDDGTTWHETTYSDGKWGSSLRGLISWQGSNTIRYDGATLDQSTAIAMALTPTREHVISVCADHTLKIWNLEKASSVFQMDLLGDNRLPQDISKVMLDPGISGVLQIFQAEGAIEGDQYYIATYSPLDQGKFKIWAVRDADQGKLGVRYLFPDSALKAPDPEPNPSSKAVWKMTDFKIKEGADGKDMALWVLMRSNKRYQIFNLRFDLGDLPNAWETNWTTTTRETLDQQTLPRSSNLELQSVSELWIDYILCPERFPQVVLETALAVYNSSQTTGQGTNQKASLEERMCLAVESRALFQQTDNQLDFIDHHAAMQQEWSLFHQTVQDIHKPFWNVLSLSYDNHAEMPWLAFAGGCAPLRDSSRVEILVHNNPADLHESPHLLESLSVEDENGTRDVEQPHELAVMIQAAARFRESFSQPLRLVSEVVLVTELWQNPSSSVPIRMQSFYDQCDFGNAIGDGVVDTLHSTLADGIGELGTDLFMAILDELSHLMPTEASGLRSTKFGLRTIVKGAQELIELHHSILFDLLVVVVMLEVEPANMSTEGFDRNAVYMSLVEQLKRYQMMRWLACNTRQDPDSRTDSPEGGPVKSAASSSAPLPVKSSTVLENLFAADLEPQSYYDQTQSAALTYSIQDLLNWVTGGNDQSITLDQALVHVQCNLLVNKNYNLASDFLQFQPSTAWATYIKGRLFLLRRDFRGAAMFFQKAAFKLSRQTKVSAADYPTTSSHLLSPAEAAHFNNGLPAYYSHILALFEAASSPSYAADFARLALQLQPESTQLLSSLFRSSLLISDFLSAFSALTRLPQSEQSELLPDL